MKNKIKHFLKRENLVETNGQNHFIKRGPISINWYTEMIHICYFIILHYESYWMGDLSILEITLQFIE